MSAELKMFNKMKKEAEKLEKSSLSNIPTSSNNGLEDNIDHTGNSHCLFSVNLVLLNPDMPSLCSVDLDQLASEEELDVGVAS